MLDSSAIIGTICSTYDALWWLAPYVATLIVGGGLFCGLVIKQIPMGAIMLAVLMALIIGSLSLILGSLGVTVGCS